MIHLFSIGFFFAWTAAVAISDCRDRRISNELVLVGLAAVIIFTVCRQNPFNTTLTGALIGGVVGLVSLFPFFALRVMGAADVKVFAVLGAWCGLSALPWLWIVASVAAGIHALGLMFLSRTPFGSLGRSGAPAFALGAHRSAPYAAFLVAPAAAWLVYLIHTGGTR
ncbi:A24 family peptidase [Burkholderia sp. ABCPW 111]|uniref:A24 family peptidase n=1 Tax=Burkholderia sp. ABCPW 111 TaxID=1820025 RepID=UPI000572948A|nr:prepilin peptidase [Burkholderia sp. ABCPW 111]